VRGEQGLRDLVLLGQRRRHTSQAIERARYD
jgi:hypothetical protein